MELTGTIKKVFDTEVVSEKFTKRNFVLIIGEEYPQEIIMQLSQVRVSLGDTVRPNDEVRVSFNLRGKMYNNPEKGEQYFNTVEAWKIEVLRTARPVSSEAPAKQSAGLSGQSTDDLPF